MKDEHSFKSFDVLLKASEEIKRHIVSNAIVPRIKEIAESWNMDLNFAPNLVAFENIKSGWLGFDLSYDQFLEFNEREIRIALEKGADIRDLDTVRYPLKARYNEKAEGVNLNQEIRDVIWEQDGGVCRQRACSFTSFIVETDDEAFLAFHSSRLSLG